MKKKGFGLIGILNRKEEKELENFYVFTNQDDLMKNWANRKNLAFHRFNTSLLYIENIYTHLKKI
jgi:hypothetical protein